MSDSRKYACWRGFYSLIKIAQRVHICILKPLLSDVLFMAVSHKSRLYMFTRWPVCLLVAFPRPQEKARERAGAFFFPVHLKNSSIVLCRSPHCCGNVWPSRRTVRTSTGTLCTGPRESAQQRLSFAPLKHNIVVLWVVYAPFLCLCCVHVRVPVPAVEWGRFGWSWRSRHWVEVTVGARV